MRENLERKSDLLKIISITCIVCFFVNSCFEIFDSEIYVFLFSCLEKRQNRRCEEKELHKIYKLAIRNGSLFLSECREERKQCNESKF